MIKAKHHSIIYPFFKWLTRFLIKRNFNSIKIESDFVDNGKAILLISNHISWWDGFWMEYFNQKTTHRKFNFMMLEDQLRKHWYFQYIGGFSIKKKSKEILESIGFAIELLKNNDNVVLMFPQGEIHSAYNNSIQFERGIQHILREIDNDVQIIFAASFFDYFSDPKPNVYIYTKTFCAGLLGQDIEKQYNLFYINMLNYHQTKTS